MPNTYESPGSMFGLWTGPPGGEGAKRCARFRIKSDTPLFGRVLTKIDRDLYGDPLRCVLLLTVMILGACASNGTTATRTDTRSGLAGLDVNTASMFVKTPVGVAVVDTARDGHPAIAISTPSGSYRWVSNDAIGALGGGQARRRSADVAKAGSHFVDE